MLGNHYHVQDNNAAGNFLINLVYGVVNGEYSDEYSIAMLCIARCLDPHFYAFFATRDQQDYAMALSKQLFQTRPGIFSELK
jgi:hypothetical protein